jgi:hypothetical protein
MTSPFVLPHELALVHAHDSRIHFKLDEIDKDLETLATEIHTAIDAVLDARRKVCVLTIRRQEIAADIAILREMLGVR